MYKQPIATLTGTISSSGMFAPTDELFYFSFYDYFNFEDVFLKKLCLASMKYGIKKAFQNTYSCPIDNKPTISIQEVVFNHISNEADAPFLTIVDNHRLRTFFLYTNFFERTEEFFSKETPSLSFGFKAHPEDEYFPPYIDSEKVEAISLNFHDFCISDSTGHYEQMQLVFSALRKVLDNTANTATFSYFLNSKNKLFYYGASNVAAISVKSFRNQYGKNRKNCPDLLLSIFKDSNN
ncbi:MAG: hypothetical protein N3A54_00720 [Patescibacteria group bacterium]|nr:hypothetical protein [Patescibacteria group bacterium]